MFARLARNDSIFFVSSSPFARARILANSMRGVLSVAVSGLLNLLARMMYLVASSSLLNIVLQHDKEHFEDRQLAGDHF